MCSYRTNKSSTSFTTYVGVVRENRNCNRISKCIPNMQGEFLLSPLKLCNLKMIRHLGRLKPYQKAAMLLLSMINSLATRCAIYELNLFSRHCLPNFRSNVLDTTLEKGCRSSSSFLQAKSGE